MLERLIAKYGVFPLACAGFVLLIIMAFATIAGINKIKASWYESVAEAAKAQVQVQKANVKVLKQDIKKTDVAVEVAVETVKKQDRTANRQRQATAKAKDIVHERIIKNPAVDHIDVIDPVVFDQVRQARDRAVAASGAVSGTQGAGLDTASADIDGLSSMGELCGQSVGIDRTG